MCILWCDARTYDFNKIAGDKTLFNDINKES